MPGCITRLDPIDVMYVREFEKPDEEAFSELEAVVGTERKALLRGLRRRSGGGTGHVSSAASKTTQPV